jgi:uncharacterized membrane protein
MDVGLNSGIYKFVFVLHLVAVVAGFGPLALNAVYSLQARRRGGREGVAIAEANLFVSERVATPFVYAVPVLGILLVLLSDDVFEFDQAWISISFLLYLVLIGLIHAVLRPAVRRMNALTADLAARPPTPGGGGPPPEVAEVQALGQRVGVMAAVLNVLVVVIIALMVWRPGAPI